MPQGQGILIRLPSTCLLWMYLVTVLKQFNNGREENTLLNEMLSFIHVDTDGNDNMNKLINTACTKLIKFQVLYRKFL